MRLAKKAKAIPKMGANMEGINEKAAEDGGGAGDSAWALAIVATLDMTAIATAADLITLLLDAMISIDEMIFAQGCRRRRSGNLAAQALDWEHK